MGFLGGAGMAGAAGGANQALQNFLQFYMHNKELEQRKAQMLQQKGLQEAQMEDYRAQTAERTQKTDEAKRQAQQDIAMQKELAGLYMPKSAADMAFAPGVIEGGGGNGQPAVLTPQGEGMMTGQPTGEQLMNLYSRYASPKEGLVAQVSLANTEEKLKTALEIQGIKNKADAQRLWDKLDSTEKMWRERDDARSQAIADRFDAKMKELEKLYDLKAELQAAKSLPDRTDKDQMALARAQQMAKRDLEMEYTHDALTGQWLKEGGVPEKQSVINAKNQKYVQKYMAGGKVPVKTTSDPLGIR